MFERINYKNQAREQLKGKLKTPIIAFVFDGERISISRKYPSGGTLQSSRVALSFVCSIEAGSSSFQSMTSLYFCLN